MNSSIKRVIRNLQKFGKYDCLLNKIEIVKMKTVNKIKSREIPSMPKAIVTPITSLKGTPKKNWKPLLYSLIIIKGS